jgi:hypothetical protein
MEMIPSMENTLIVLLASNATTAFDGRKTKFHALGFETRVYEWIARLLPEAIFPLVPDRLIRREVVVTDTFFRTRNRRCHGIRDFTLSVESQ